MCVYRCPLAPTLTPERDPGGGGSAGLFTSPGEKIRGSTGDKAVSTKWDNCRTGCSSGAPQYCPGYSLLTWGKSGVTQRRGWGELADVVSQLSTLFPLSLFQSASSQWRPRMKQAGICYGVSATLLVPCPFSLRVRVVSLRLLVFCLSGSISHGRLVILIAGSWLCGIPPGGILSPQGMLWLSQNGSLVFVRKALNVCF